MTEPTQKLPVQRLIYLGLGLITLVLYLPAMQHGFVDYDDQQYVTENPRVQAGLTWSGLVWAFGFHAGNWHPLAWLSHMLDCQLFEARAGGHHLTSILLHVASTLLLFSVLNRMTKSMWRSAAVAALFAWHPLHVESVAWVAERKDVLCAFFWMLTLWFYARFVEQSKVQSPKSKVFYSATLLSFTLALMAKPMAVTLPFVLLLLDYWPLKRFAIYDLRFTIYKNLLLEKIPFLLLAGIGCALTLHAQQIAIVSTAGLTLPQRLVHTLVAYNHYFWAMFSPFNLSVYYPYVIKLESATVIFSSLLVLMLTVLAVIQWRKRPYLIVGWLWFLGTLVPVIGLVQVGDQAWADRYTYLPLIGLFVALVWFVSESITSRMWLGVFSAGIAVVLIVTTSLQLRHWQNTRTLFEHADQVTPHNYMAITLLGSLLAKEHKLDEAMSHYRRALSYQPAYPEAHFFMGYALDEQGKFDEAIAEYQQALWFRPTQEQTHIFMAIALGKQKKYSEATEHYSAALKLNPDSAVAHNNLARILHTQGQFSAAIEHYQLALEIDPKLELAHNNLGVLLLQQGDLVGGTKQLREALKLKPNNMETEFNLAVALSQQEQWGEAADHFSNTASLHPNDPKSRYQFGFALAHLDRAQEAMSQFASALLIQPDYADALDGLAWLLSTDSHADLRNGSEAVKMAERACELTSNQEPTKLLTLAAAYAEVGQFDKATNTLQTAKAMATKASLLNLIKQSALMQEHFQKSEPWREGPAQ